MQKIRPVNRQGILIAIDHCIISHLEVRIEIAVVLTQHTFKAQRLIIHVQTGRIQIGCQKVAIVMKHLILLIGTPVIQRRVHQRQWRVDRIDVQIFTACCRAVTPLVKQFRSFVERGSQRLCSPQNSLLLTATEVILHAKNVLVAEPGDDQQKTGQEDQLGADAERIFQGKRHGLATGDGRRLCALRHTAPTGPFLRSSDNPYRTPFQYSRTRHQAGQIFSGSV